MKIHFIPGTSARRSAFLVLFLGFLLLLAPSIRVRADELTPASSSSGSTITVTSREGTPIGAVYVKWSKPIAPYTLTTDTDTLEGGQFGFLHEFISLENPSQKLTFQLPADCKAGIYEIRIFTDNQVPEDVQIWQPPCDRADILLISSHSDDEILFMGGIGPTYGAQEGARVQVVYMTEFWTTTPVREHEKLDGLWADGIRYYPVCGNFKDLYAKDLESAKKVYDPEELTVFLVETIERFRPQVLVTHDFNGEYGHGFHCLTAEVAAQALVRADEVWQVPKAYFHLYPENKIRMDLNVPLSSMDGRTALEVAKEAYTKHVSQQWCWFYVSDTYEYSCADFGLFRSLVGPDTRDDMLENITLYDVIEENERQEALRLEEERLEAERLEELAKIDAQLEALRKESEDKAAQAAAELEAIAADLEKARLRTGLIVLAGGVIVLLALCYLCVPLFRIHRPRRKKGSNSTSSHHKNS